MKTDPKKEMKTDFHGFGAKLATWTLAEAGMSAFQTALKWRHPQAWAELRKLARAIQTANERECNIPELEPKREARRLRLEARADALAIFVFGEDAKAHIERDPRGFPLFISWPGMPDGFRDHYEPERGMPWHLHD